MAGHGVNFEPFVPPAEKQIDVTAWMEWFVGVSEANLIKNKADFIDHEGNFKQPGGRTFHGGTFEWPSVADLRKHVEEMVPTREAANKCPLRVLDGIDIGNHQASFTTEQKAMVQIASNMHCLENGNPNTSADCGGLVSGYARDSTQGPAAAFGVPAASLVRAHYAFKDRDTPEDGWGQTAERQVNLIKDICVKPDNYCGGCCNGKAQLFGDEKVVTVELIDDVAAKVRVGLHCDTQVVFRRGISRRSLTVNSNASFVDQVCSSTLCYGYAWPARQRPPKDQLANLTRALLRAAYEGAYLAAIRRQRKHLLLTLIGGACFGNPMDMILEELKRAHGKYAEHPASELEEVQLLIYEPGAGPSYTEILNNIDEGLLAGK